MEQWILDGRSLIRQRDPAKHALAAGDVRAALGASNPEVQCFTSMLLAPERCRVVNSSDDPGCTPRLEFAFDCLADGAGVAGNEDAGAGWFRGRDLTGVFGFVRVDDDGCAADEAAPDARPNPYAECTASLRWYHAGELVDAVDEFEFVAGAGVVPQAAEEAVLSMTEGRTATFLCDPACAFRDNGLARPSVPGKRVPADAVVTLRVTLHRFQNPITDAEKLARVTALKDEGNALIAAKDFPAAVKAYQAALHRLSSGVAAGSGATDAAHTEQIRAQLRAMKVTLLHNLAVATVSQDSISAQVASVAAGHCTRALAIDPDHAKSRFRRALCLAQQRKWPDALDDLQYLASRNLGDAAAIDAARERIRAESGGR
eukprot:CAMPEP_0174854836 /NCGR_PEP_ID=MMETSP1114-20130205/31976_1 /TAXON_ID=312471 /ORGANISM="Neobodo designis, Strain CCAP 1951/1" /LENGTH=372 /DNA_ID=CAMNT_0016089547 /DNA_START=38 /DNA_END=1156 /DNA_ORIENTATION=-